MYSAIPLPDHLKEALPHAGGFGPTYYDRMTSWYRLRRSTARHQPCPRYAAGLHHLDGPRGCSCQGLIHGPLDHGRSWLTTDGGRVVTGEPYGLSAEAHARISTLADDLDLVLQWLPVSAWAPGSTVAFALTKPGVAIDTSGAPVDGVGYLREGEA